MKAFLYRCVSGLRALFRQNAREQDLNDELRAYLDAAVDARMATGMSRADATRAARLELGSLDGVKQSAREAGWESLLESTWQDVRFACRLLRKSPGFTAAAVVTLGLGIGGTTAVFSIVDALFLRAPEGVANPARIRRVYVKRDAGNVSSPSGSGGVWVDSRELQQDRTAFSDAAAYELPRLIDLGRGEAVEQIRGSVISHNLLNVLGVRPAAGRFFLPEDDEVPGERPVVVISHEMWQTRFAGASRAIGSQLLINGRPMQIIGVTQRGFLGVEATPVAAWLPSAMAGQLGLADSTRDWRFRGTGVSGDVRHVARLTPKVNDETAAQMASVSLQRAAARYPLLDPTPEVVLKPLVLAGLPFRTREANLSLWAALAAALLLLIACANVANLLLGRAVARRREFAMRLALGAGIWRVARQQLTESAVIGVLGGCAGIAATLAVMGVMQEFPIPPTATQLDARLLGFSIALSVVTGLLFGVLPALRAARLNPISALKGVGVVGDSNRRSMSRVLVGVQVSLSLALLVGAGLFVRSLARISTIDSGVTWERLIVVSTKLEPPRYTREAREAFFSLALSRLSVLPGVERAAIAHTPPLAWSYYVPWYLAGRTQEAQMGKVNLVSPDYFETVGTRVLRGRAILASDRAGTEAVGVVNEVMARLLADDGNATGLCVSVAGQVGSSRCTRIVGVVESQRDDYLDSQPQPMVYRARAQFPNSIPYGTPVLIARTASDPAHYRRTIQSALQTLQPDLPHIAVETMAERLRPETLPFRLGATLFGMFGVLAVVLAGIGLYGLLGYFVAERTAEIGVRRALGAPAGAVIALVARQSLAPVMLGLLVGLTASYIGSRYLGSLLFGVEARDPLAFGVGAAFLFLTGLLATVIPALRAARIDPLVALRQE